MNRLFQERVEKYEGTFKFSVIQQRSLFDTEQAEGFYLSLGFAVRILARMVQFLDFKCFLKLLGISCKTFYLF